MRKPKTDPHWIAREFEIWLKSNHHRFIRTPYLHETTKRGAEYRFRGVTGRIALYMDSYQFLISIRNYAFIAEFDVALEQTKSGRYYCSLCTPKYRKHYGSRTALLETHCFELMLKWVNSNLRPEKSLIIRGKLRGWSSAQIVDSSTAKRKKKFDRFKYPVILETKTKQKR